MIYLWTIFFLAKTGMTDIIISTDMNVVFSEKKDQLFVTDTHVKTMNIRSDVVQTVWND